MDYIRTNENGQLVFEESTEYLQIPSCLYGFIIRKLSLGKQHREERFIVFRGNLTFRKENADVNVESDCISTVDRTLPFAIFLSAMN